MEEQIRLNKYLQQAGIASRRKSDELISQGLVKINGKVVTEMGIKVLPGKDKIEVDGEKLKEQQQKLTYYKFYKPKGVECTFDENVPDNLLEFVMDLEKGTTYLGRLDKISEGLLLLSNDGRFAYKVTHPKFSKEKEYEVTSAHPIDEYTLSRLSDEFVIDGYRTQAAKVFRVSSRKFRIILKEGRNRQIRKMCRKLDIKIHRLKRTRVGNITLGDLEIGEVKPLNNEEMNFVKKSLKD